MEHVKNIAAIDLGVNNFVCMTNSMGYMPVIIKGGALKSMYHYYTTEKQRLQEDLKQKQKNQVWSKRLRKLTINYQNKVTAWYYHVVKVIMNYCMAWDIDTMVIGDGRVSIMFSEYSDNTIETAPMQFIEILKNQCTKNDITFVRVSEQYTSGTSFIDGEYPSKLLYDNTRCDGRLFKTDSGRIINGDVNASYQILRKAYPHIIDDGKIKTKYCLEPVILKITRDGESYETGSNKILSDY